MSWLPKSLGAKPWTWGELAQDRTTNFINNDGKRMNMPRQLIHIWRSTPAHIIADFPENEQRMAIQRQRIAMAIYELYPSEKKEKRHPVVKTKAS